MYNINYIDSHESEACRIQWDELIDGSQITEGSIVSKRASESQEKRFE